MMVEGDHPSLSVSRQCRLLALSRSALYYQPVGESAETLTLMRRIDELYLSYPFYGSRQMMRHLAREGVTVGRHRVRRLMRLLGLEAIYRKPRTTVANPEHRVYPYLLRGLTIERPNHVWCSDITYIPVQDGLLLYRVAIMDVGNGLALLRDDEVVHPHVLRIALRPPLPATVLELSDQLLLLGIHRNDRMTLLLSTAHLLVEVVELRIPTRVLGAFGALAVRLQGVAELVQQLVDHTMTHRVPRRLQLGGELAHALGGPPQGAVVRRDMTGSCGRR